MANCNKCAHSFIDVPNMREVNATGTCIKCKEVEDDTGKVTG